MSMLEGLARTPGKSYSRIEDTASHQRLADCARVMEAVSDVGLKFLADRKAIDADRDLSLEGRRKQAVELAEKTVAEIEKRQSVGMIRGALKELARDAAQGLDLEFPTGVEAAVFEMEARNTLRSMRELDRLEVLRKAVNENDLATVAAFVRAPRFQPLVNRELLERFVDQLKRARNPERFNAHAQFTDALARLDRHVEWVCAEIRKEAGIVGTTGPQPAFTKSA